MASASTIPITHVQGSSLTTNVGPDQTQFPSLPGSSSEEKDHQWEFLDQPTPAAAAAATAQQQQVSFCPKTVPPDTAADVKPNPKVLHHAASSPNLREYVLESDSSEDGEGTDAVFIEEEENTDGGSSAVMVSGPPSVWSAGGLSFRDAIMKNKAKGSSAVTTTSVGNTTTQSSSHKKHVIKKVKPKFVVVTQPIRRASRSCGDLLSLVHEDDEEVLGDTDAEEYYGRKSAGAQGRQNGLKTRPDEAKRLQITMAKKQMQRQRQGL